MTLTNINRLLARAARLVGFAARHPRCFQAALAGRCTITLAEDGKAALRGRVALLQENQTREFVNPHVERAKATGWTCPPLTPGE